LSLPRTFVLLFFACMMAAPALSGETWYIRPDGGTRYSAKVPAGQCDGKADAPYRGKGTNQRCAFNDFRFMWDDQSYNSITWVMHGGDTVIIHGCHANAQQMNPSNPDCRIGWDESAWGGQPNFWCLGGGPYQQSSYGCYNPPVPAGTASQHTRILGANYQNCSTNNQPDTTKTATLFGGFSVLNTLSLANTQYVDVECIHITSHNGICTVHGSPSTPRGCHTSYPLDDYDGNGILVNANTANVTLQDVAVDGHTTSGITGPIGANFNMNRVFVGFNGFAGWNFDDGHNSPNGTGASINADYVKMEGNGCYQQWPIANPQFPARACYDDVSGGFGDSWSGQDSTLVSFTCNHCQQLYNTKDGFIGPHTTVSHLTIINSESIGNMGQQWKWGGTPGSTTIFQNNLTVGNCQRMSEPIPGAPAGFNRHLSDFCRAAGDIFSFFSAPNSTVLFSNDTTVGYSATMFDLNCRPENSCKSTRYIFRNSVMLGFLNSKYNTSNANVPGLFYISDNSDTVTADHNLYYNLRMNGCPGTGSKCLDPMFVHEPDRTIRNESELDSLDVHPRKGSPAIGTGTAVDNLTADFFGAKRPANPSLGAAEPTP
jgi:hypothetical protein